MGRKHRPAFSDRWEGPFPVTAVYGNAVELDLSSNPRLAEVSRQWNVAQIQPYHAATTEASAPPAIPPHLAAPPDPAESAPTILAASLPEPRSDESTDHPPTPRPAFANTTSDVPQGNEDLSPTFDYTPRHDITCFMESRRVNNKLEYRLHTQNCDPASDRWVPARDITRHPELQYLLKNFETYRRQQRLRERRASARMFVTSPPTTSSSNLLLLF